MEDQSSIPMSPEPLPPPPIDAGASLSTNWGKWIVAIVVLVVLVAAGVVAVVLLAGGGGTVTKEDVPTGRVRRGTFVMSFTERGEIRAAEQVVIRNPIGETVTIDSVLEEGTRVKTGDVIITFLSEKLDDDIVSMEEVVESTRLEKEKSKENIKLTEKDNASQLTKSKNALKNAQESLEKFRDQDMQLELDDARSESDLAKGDLVLAEQKLVFKKEVNGQKGLEGTYSDSEIEADELRVARLKLMLKKAETKLVGLTKYDHKRMLRTLGEGVAEAELDQERVVVKTRTDLLLAQSDLAADTERHNRKKAELAELMEDKGKLTVKAERPGLIVYDRGDRHRSSPDIRTGARVGPHDRLMIIPDMETLQISSKVFESRIPYVEARKEGEDDGTQVLIRLDAIRGEAFPGYVSWVANMPSSQSWWSSSVKSFPITIKFDELPDGLRPNTSAQVELIVVAEERDVLSVPIAAVFTEQEQTYCWRVTGEGYKKTPVTIGRESDTRLEIIAGVEEDDIVALTPPPGQSAKPGDETKQDPKKAPKIKGGSKLPGGKPVVSPGGKPGAKPGGRPSGGTGRPKRPAGAGATSKPSGRQRPAGAGGGARR